MANVFEIAKWFLQAVDRQSGETISHLKLQKLVYYAQAWSIALRNEPLFGSELQAWAHGPVSKELYDEYKSYGYQSIEAPSGEPDICAEESEHLEMIWDAYGDISAKKLEDMTHQEEPWLEARGGLPNEARCDTIISHETMSRFYKELYERTKDNGEEIH